MPAGRKASRMTRPIGGGRRAVMPGRVTSAGATPETSLIAGRGEASSSVRICAHEPHEAFILGPLLRGGYRPFETIFLRGMAEAAAGWRWGVTGPEGRDGFETMLLGWAA